MKQIFLALSLGLLLFATSCIGKPGKRDIRENNQQTENIQPEIVSKLSQEYFTMEENRPAITGEIKNGELWLTFNEDQIQPLNITDDDSYRLPEGPIRVEGLKGAPKDFIIADIGQDYNPILCVLTDQGKVQVLSLWDAVATGDVEATEIPMDNIVGFKAGPGGPWEDEDGSVFYDHTTIYGIDARGGEHEVPLYLWERNIEHVYRASTGTLVFQLFLSQDWKMRYVVGYHFSEKLEEMQGRFWSISEDWDNMVFRFGYELTTHMQYDNEGINTTEVRNQGVFEMRYPEVGSQNCFITPIEGVDFCESGLNVPVLFEPCGAYGG